MADRLTYTSLGENGNDTYRWSLWRSWSSTADQRACTFVMLNPSTADGRRDDPTIRRCVGFASREGFTGIHVVNLFALRATDPAKLKMVPDPVGPANDSVILDAVRSSEFIVAAWGQHGPLFGRDEAVLRLLEGHRIWCLGTTKKGQPRHPLPVRKSAPMERYR